MRMNKTLALSKKKILSIAAVAVLLISVFPLQAHAVSIPEYLRVGLYYSSTALSSCEASCDEGFILGTAEADNFTEVLPLPAYTTLCATVENDHVVLRDQDGILISSDIGTNGCLMPADYADGGTITIQKANYRGGLLLKATSNDKLTIINYVELEEYLYGVIHLEMSQGNPMEALKAQTVAARSFAVTNLAKHSDYGFDVCNNTNCQVYGGCSAEYPSTISAVDETKGLLIWSGGEPVAVYYHKNSGGYTQSVEDVWSYPLSYLTGVSDPYSPDYPWTATMDFDTIAEKLLLGGYEVGTVKSVEIAERNSSGAVAKLVITGDEDTVTLEKEKIRTVFGTALIKSRMFNLGDTFIEQTAAAVIHLAGNAAKGAAGDTVYVLGAAGTAKSIASSGLYVTNGSTTQLAEASGSGTAEKEIATGGELVLSGRGYGHGVGMSQDGAIQMAKDGFTYEQILKYYFTGIEIK